MSNLDERIIIGLDLGSSKVTALAGRAAKSSDLDRAEDRNNHIEVMAHSTKLYATDKSANQEAMESGVPLNKRRVTLAIKTVFSEIFRQLSPQAVISEIVVNLNGASQETMYHEETNATIINHTEISEGDIYNIYKAAIQHHSPKGSETQKVNLLITAQEFKVHGKNTPLIEPVGVEGYRMTSLFHFVIGNTREVMQAVQLVNSSIKELETTPNKAKELSTPLFAPEASVDAGVSSRFNGGSIIVLPTVAASSFAMLNTEDEKGAVCVIDFGSDTINIAIYDDMILRYTAVVECGSSIITKDIAGYCTIPFEQAEQLKVNFGSCMPHNVPKDETIYVRSLRGKTEKLLEKRKLAELISSRVVELITLVYLKLVESKYINKLKAETSMIYLTGGGSQLDGFCDLFEFMTTCNTTHRDVQNVTGSKGDFVRKTPSASVALGLIKLSLKPIDYRFHAWNLSVMQLHKYDIALAPVLVEDKAAAKASQGNKAKKGPGVMQQAVRTLSSFIGGDLVDQDPE